ncbi:ankyrin repeat domain-containing protein 33B-like isoform X1 [Hypanus sabinus]|uniref:ankyrin repeat domain-containing protein 33B-like isoform X1 n=1 Tax=Hypanus sabinus TaxID=79690 RepID=UPI0028C4819F|nr:ankyrin repeat domain-containing protein 33B-like isoform X1 [Hypanus sabinus]XP_059812116.1 ankyrin repeat domain-containing protein 33B-like isoform X1 [Hypanus sabinus]XP_059812117.1 ankyrin repeat domain-containing protein 33B-like isoform X1 [Hypanus sabinus]XP_059812118.1 ankyrin repeat domain-containing protein 33B-like isoform X1 [Hypanus sabinus]XP_059812119.1 ankyrin repeat domain-containing protein 33B-like isoform X1 [Hypanus sabinus]
MAKSGDSIHRKAEDFISAAPCYRYSVQQDPNEGYSGKLEGPNSINCSPPETEQNGEWQRNKVPIAYEACAQRSVWEMLMTRVEEEEISEADEIERNEVMIGCCWGFLGRVNPLSGCSRLDVNHQDQDGSTALITAAQAGADAKANDPPRGRTAQEWVLPTGRFEDSLQTKQPLGQPYAKQVEVGYAPEWSNHGELSVKGKTSEKITDQLKSMLRIKVPFNPEKGDVLDYAVKITTNLFIATTCMNNCPTSPPVVGTHQDAVTKIRKCFSLTQVSETLQQSKHVEEPGGVITPPVYSEKRNGARPKQRPQSISSKAARAHPIDFPSLPLPIRNCAVPTSCIPQIELINASPPTYEREGKQLSKNKNLLTLPKWKYQQMREDRKAAKAVKNQLMEKNKRAQEYSIMS